jgi:hypothetical protein
MDPDVYKLMTAHLVQGSQESAYGNRMVAEAQRLGHIAGAINQKEALGTRIALESGSGRERTLQNTP